MTLDPAAPDLRLTDEDWAALRQAVSLLEEDTFSETVMNLVGRSVGGGLERISRVLPASLRTDAATWLERVLESAFRAVVLTIDSEGRGLTGRRWLDRPLSSSWIDGASAILAGAFGGAGGLATTAVELPVTTALLMRAIAQIAVRHGEDLRTDEAKLECLKVFALGGTATGDGEVDAGYYSVRIAVAEAIPKLAHRTLQDLLPKVLARVAERFSGPVTAKLGSQAAPGIGAVAGALINLAFVDHFERKATGHFTLRRLERAYGPARTRSAYEAALVEWAREREAGRSAPQAAAAGPSPRP